MTTPRTTQTTWRTVRVFMECTRCGQIDVLAPVEVAKEQIAVRHEEAREGHEVWSIYTADEKVSG